MSMLFEILVILVASGLVLVPILAGLSRLTARPSGPARGVADGEEPGPSRSSPPWASAVRDGTGSTALWLLESGTRKLELIKAVHACTGLDLREAKDLVEAAPTAVFHGLDAADAARVREALEAAGGSVELRGRDGGEGPPGVEGPETAPSPAEAPMAWDVVLRDPGVSPDRALAALEETLGLTREEAEDAVMAAPGRVARGVAQEVAEAAREALEAAGAQVAVRPGEG